MTSFFQQWSNICDQYHGMSTLYAVQNRKVKQDFISSHIGTVWPGHNIMKNTCALPMMCVLFWKFVTNIQRIYWLTLCNNDYLMQFACIMWKCDRNELRFPKRSCPTVYNAHDFTSLRLHLNTNFASLYIYLSVECMQWPH